MKIYKSGNKDFEEEKAKIFEEEPKLKNKKEQLKKVFKTILLDLIEKIDSGANILLGNEELAIAYTNMLIKEVSIRTFIK